MDVIMPQLGETVLEGTIAAWYKKVGDAVKADEPLFDLETDKVTTEIPAPVSGVLTEILIPTGKTVKVGTRLAVIDSGEAVAPKPATAATENVVQAGAASIRSTTAAIAGAPLPRSGPGGPKLSPLVRRLLGEHDIAPERVTGTGAHGRITREDIHGYLARMDADQATPAAVPAVCAAPQATVAVAVGTSSVPVAPATPEQPAAVPGADDFVVPLNKIRRLTGAHMVRSKAISPHTLQAVEVDFHEVDKVRRTVGGDWKTREGYSLTYLPFIARAVCEAIAKFPYINSSFGDDELIVHKRVHLGNAVDLNFDGLLVTVLRDAHHKNLRGMASELNRLARAARNGSLKPDELSGGTYTLSNSGSFGTLISAPVINQPQAAILSCDGVHKKPAVVETADGDLIAIRPIGILAQSFDHRAFDGAYSAAFLKCLKEILETRNWLAEI